MDNGYVGTQQQWLASLVGTPGNNGVDGVGIANAYVNNQQHLILEMTNGSSIDAGYVGAGTAPTLYSVIFYDYNGTTVLKSQQVESGTSATPPADPSRTGYEFTGWSGTYTNVTKNETVIATYRELITEPSSQPSTEPSTQPTSYTVTFKDYNGTELKRETVVRGGSATPPANPSRGGYSFDGWEGTYTNVTANVTVTAKYTQKTNPMFIVDTVTASAGAQNVTVTIEVRNNPGILGGIIELSYNSNLTLKSASNGNVFQPLTFQAPGAFASPCMFSWDGQEDMATSDGAILVLVFDVSGNVQQGDELEINCRCVPDSIYNSSFQLLTVEAIGGYVNIQ